MTIETQPFDPAEYLETEEDVRAYLGEAFENGDLALISVALRTARRARDIRTLPGAPAGTG